MLVSTVPPLTHFALPRTTVPEYKLTNKNSLRLKATMHFQQNNTRWMTLLNVNADINTFALFLILITPCLVSYLLYGWLIDFLWLGEHRVAFCVCPTPKINVPFVRHKIRQARCYKKVRRICQRLRLNLRVSSSACYFDKSAPWFLIAAKFYS